MTDTDRIKKIAAKMSEGDTEVFGILVEDYKDRIHQFICYFAGYNCDIEDIAQEVFVQVFKSIKTFKGESSFNTWIYALTRNICRRHLRNKITAERFFCRIDDTENVWAEIPDYSVNLELDFENENMRGQVDVAIDGLPPIHKTALFLHIWEKMPYADIAQTLDIPLGTVKSRIHNGLAMLAEKLHPLLGGTQ